MDDLSPLQLEAHRVDLCHLQDPNSDRDLERQGQSSASVAPIEVAGSPCTVPTPTPGASQSLIFAITGRLRNAVQLVTRTTHPLQLWRAGEQHAPKPVQLFSEHLFVIVHTSKGGRAILVPCNPRPESASQETPIPTRLSCEPKEKDRAVWERIRHKLYAYHGSWKEYLPFYGPRTVEEVMFAMPGARDNKNEGVFLADNVQRIDADIAYENYMRTYNKHTGLQRRGRSDFCDEFHHTEYCPKDRDDDDACLVDYVAWSRRLMNRCKRSYTLKTRARRPHLADDYDTLSGVVGENPRYSSRDHQTTDPESTYNGIAIELGWQWTRIGRELPVPTLSALLGVSVVWIVVAVWVGATRQWSTALAFAQVLAASIAMLWFTTASPAKRD